MPLTTSNYANVESEIYQRLINNGFNLAQTCGILANIEYETAPDYNPESYNSTEGAYGLCQWRKGRKVSLFNKYGNSPISVENQVRYIIDELNGEDSIAKGCLDGIANTREGSHTAGFKFADKFERCAESSKPGRADRAQSYWDYYSNGGTSLNPSVDLTVPDSTPAPGVSTSVGSWVIDQSNVEHLANNLDRVSTAGYDYGYLIDLNHDRELKFYIPEFQESAGVNWDSIHIPGRSVDIHSYNTTNSRKISISLDLYAGVGLYTSDAYEDVVGAIHEDANFVKSLEYPDYEMSLVKPPASVHLILGSAVNMEGIIEDVTVEHLKPLDSQNRSMYLKLSFTVTQNVLDPPGSAEIRNGITAVYTSTS